MFGAIGQAARNPTIFESSEPPHQTAEAGLNAVGAVKLLALALVRAAEALEQNRSDRVSSEINLTREVQRFEADLIRSALILTGGKQRRAARLLGVKVTTLHAKIKRHNIDCSGLGKPHERFEEEAD
jgi:transcriptional regulator with GAF, ATPase, and Fis domain